MSTSGSSRDAGDRRFRRLVGVVLVSLLLVAGIAAFAGSVQGPKLVRTDVDTAGLVETSGQRVVMYVNQQLGELDADAVTITPKADFQTSASGNMITLQFAGPLAYDTQYTVAVKGARSPGGGVASDLSTSFETSRPALYSLVREPVPADDPQAKKGDDRIEEVSLEGSPARTVYASSRIQEFAEVGSSLAVVTQSLGGLNELALVDVASGKATPVELPKGGVITQVRSSPSQGIMGFLFTEQSFGREGGDNLTLYSLDTRKANAKLQRVAGIDGGAVHSLEWQFVPQTASMLVRTTDSSLELLDPTGQAAPALLGRATLIQSFIPNTTKVIVEQLDGVVVIDLTTGEAVPLVLPAFGKEEIPGQLVSLSDQLYARIYSLYDAKTVTTDQRVLAVKDGATAELFHPKDGTVVWGICASPNSQYVGVVTVPGFATGGFDGYANLPMPRGPVTEIVESATGRVVTSTPGFGLSWCPGPSSPN
ncbi:hypothetical protein [Plantibacter sp. YIM 135347]|uniref:hypothetical protein n=1 Tax=Plantibacter sp. YIM 135347 TaxID=3423919 RepID=UPI003D327C0E